MDQLKAMKAFISIVEQGSLTAAAEEIHCSPSAMARILTKLEQKLGLRLINRTTRTISLTDEGEEYLVWCKHILGEVERMNSSLEALTQNISGHLKISAPIEFGNLYVAPLVNEYLKKYPDVVIQLNLSDHLEDLVQRHFDLAIRIGHLPDSSLIATKIGYTQLVYCVSPDFICKNNHIQHPYDLADKQRILIPSYQHHWHFINDHEKFSIHVKPILTTNQIAVAKRSCIDSLGVAGFFYYQVADAIKANELITIFESYNTELIPINIVYPHVKLISPRVQHFINWFKKRTDKMCFITQSTASQ